VLVLAIVSHFAPTIVRAALLRVVLVALFLYHPSALILLRFIFGLIGR